MSGLFPKLPLLSIFSKVGSYLSILIVIVFREVALPAQVLALSAPEKACVGSHGGEAPCLLGSQGTPSDYSAWPQASIPSPTWSLWR